MFDIVLFDLDGTLTDPGQGIKNSVIHSLRKYGIEADYEDLDKFIGPPLLDSYMLYYGFDTEKATEAVEFYREYFRDRGIFENKVYEGIPEMLSQLRAKGVKIGLATSKPEVFALRILEYFGLGEYFDTVKGATLDGSLSKKGDIVRLALDALGDGKAVMVGDRLHDIVGAHENGLPCIAVLYGYGNEAEFEKYRADYTAATPLEVLHICTK